MTKVLISDKMNPLAAEIFQKNGIEVDVKPGMSAEELLDIIDDYDGLAVRSSTQATPELLGKAANMKVIGRAGIGIDNIDLEAATNKGIIVMNTPYGNSITTAEHAIAMMFALARQIPLANESTHAGKWEKSRFMGTELYAKTLGVIGCGNIGSIVANRALGLQMNVVAYDPFLSEERAEELGVEKAELDHVLKVADFITIHVPKNEKTAGLINKNTISEMKDGVRIINCARGGIIVEADLKEALDSGKVGGAALDVFEQEPATDNPLFGHENVICTPHLGASTVEAQVNVAIQVAEQMSDFLINGAITNALNMPSISAEDAPKLKPYMTLAEQVGSLAGQINEDPIKSVNIEYEGSVADLNVRPLTALLMAHLLKSQLDSVNMVNALKVADSRGIDVSVTKQGSSKDFRSLITVKITTDKRERVVAGTLFTGKEPRIVKIDNVPVEVALTPHMLYIRNEDKPGLIGGLGTILAEAGQNIADFRLGRTGRDETAVALVSLDEELPQGVFARIQLLPQIKQVKALRF